MCLYNGIYIDFPPVLLSRRLIPVFSSPLQRLHPRGQRPLSAGAAGGFTPPHPRGSGPGLAPAQPLLDRLRRQVHLRCLGGRHQETSAHQHRSERAPEHSAGSSPRVRKMRRLHGCLRRKCLETRSWRF